MSSPAPTEDEEALRQWVASQFWFHQLDLGGGVVTPGIVPLATLRRQADIYFRDGIAGRSVLDIGCWDGFNSFEAARRGASRVLATDHFVWNPWTEAGDRHVGNRECFELARRRLAPSVEAMDIDVMDISPEAVGRFDVVLFCGVFYHLRHPFLGLEKAASACLDRLVVETHVDALDVDRPAMIFYPGAELNRDISNWWGPNAACVEAMLRDLGFSNVGTVPNPVLPDRAIFLAQR
jgi:tRNA (mo5U34)-methyltransferase